MTGELLLELLSEEIPARMQRRAIEDLTGLIHAKLTAAEIPAATLRGFVTPRRLTVIAGGIPHRQPDRREERRGPRVGAPPQAIEGFLRAASLASIEQCEKRDTGRGEFYFAVIAQPGGASIEVLPELLRSAILELPWPKSMRFPAASLRWVRPLTSAICLFDGAIVPIPLDGVPVGNKTCGHRFLSEGEIVVNSAADYVAALECAHVVLDQDRRREAILTGLNEQAAADGLTLKPDPGLLDEVTGLVEYPVVLRGTIEDESMALPPEVLATAMRIHQKYFSCLKQELDPAKAGGSAAPRFLFVANNLTPDRGKSVIAGNERVLRARLADARFFWDQDRKVPLASRVEALKDRVYHAKLGSVFDKVERVEKLAAYLAEHIAGVIPAEAGIQGKRPNPSPHDPRVRGNDVGDLVTLAKRAARLAKADLSTGMVGEFPELQGVMGRYYALHDGEDARVADAIADHYKPLGPNDTCPTAPVSVAVALADKLDALAAFFAIDERPTGSRDPFALRRAALGIIRTILEGNLRGSVVEWLAGAMRGVQHYFRAHDGREIFPGDRGEEVFRQIRSFVSDRMVVHLRERGITHDIVAAFVRPGFERGENDLVRLVARIDALRKFLMTNEGRDLSVAYHRASNIVSVEERNDGKRYVGPVDEHNLQDPIEKRLSTALAAAMQAANGAISREDFTGAMTILATLRQPVDAFFDKVTVNDKEPALRENRLRLLSRIRAVMNQVADFSQIEG